MVGIMENESLISDAFHLPWASNLSSQVFICKMFNFRALNSMLMNY